MSDALFDSLARLGLVAPGRADARGEWFATAQAFGAYCDLTLMEKRDAGIAASVRDGALAWFDRTLPLRSGPFAVRTLSRDHYREDELQRFERWWDIEPDNAMDLTPVAESELPGCRAAVNRAVGALAACAPDLHDEVAEIVDEIVIMRPGPRYQMEFGGATSFALWGAVAINYDFHGNWPRYFVTLVHEAAHLLLFALAREGPLVTNGVSERAPSALRQEMRPLDGIYHAAFVSARESLALDALLIAADAGTLRLEADDRAIAEQLLAASVTGFWRCRETIVEKAHMTPLGAQLLAECEAYMAANFEFADS